MALGFKYFGILGLFVCAFFTQAASMDSLRIESHGGKNFIIHEVVQGETLYGLSRKYDVPVAEIISQNKIKDNSIDLGQLLEIPTSQMPVAKKKAATSEDQLHTVSAGETLYALSKKYGIKVDEIKDWNKLESNSLSMGQTLIVKKGNSSAPVSSAIEEPIKSKAKPVDRSKFKEYYVQTGDVLESIARKYNVRVDSIVIWNGLKNTYLAIGQKLLIKGELDSLAQTVEQKVEKTEYSTITRQPDQSGFSKILEEGVAKKIETIEDTEKYLALHRTLKIGTLVEVRNLMNNKKIFVRIVGKLPDTGLNENTLIRLSPICFKTLGILDPLTRVEISYYEN